MGIMAKSQIKLPRHLYYTRATINIAYNTALVIIIIITTVKYSIVKCAYISIALRLVNVQVLLYMQIPHLIDCLY